MFFCINSPRLFYEESNHQKQTVENILNLLWFNEVVSIHRKLIAPTMSYLSLTSLGSPKSKRYCFTVDAY